MMNLHRIVIALLVVGSLRSEAWVGPIPSPLQGVTVSTTVSKDSKTGIFTYRYRVFNPATNDEQIWSLDIDISRGPADAILSREGLVNGPRYMRHLSEDSFQRVPMVPVGISGPQEWIYLLGLDNRAPPRGLAGWGSSETTRIPPGRTLEGFELTSYGLPGIRAAEVRPDIDIDNLPGEFAEDLEKTRDLHDRLVFRTKTVGPTAPPKDFVPIEFLNYLISLLHDSRQLGWIKMEGIHKSLLAKLLEAKRALEKGQTHVTKNVLNAFLNEVRAVSCSEFECPGNKPLTSEAYVLLFFNGQFLVERL